MKMPNKNTLKNQKIKLDNINIKKINNIEDREFGFTDFSNTKAYIRFIKTVESLIRKSSEYRRYIKFLKTEADLNRGTYLSNAFNEDSKNVSVEFHHYPFSLFDIVDIVASSYCARNINRLSPFLMANEVMEIHFRNMIGLVPLTKTVHELAHNGEIFISLDKVYGNVNMFLTEYKTGVDSEYMARLEQLIDLSEKLETYYPDVLNKNITYVDMEKVDNLVPIDVKVNNLA